MNTPPNYYEKIKDEGCSKVVQQYVRSNPDIEVYEYVPRGNNGHVYFGKHKKLNEDVVLKFYWADASFNSSEEAVILRKVKHPNVLKIFDLKFLPPNFSFFLSPKISGGDLQTMLEGQTISTKVALEMIAGILQGVNELHAMHHLVHRDLKAGNVLIELGTNKPIIADLGAVKHISLASGNTTASQSTLFYLPPEAVINNRYYFQSDVYQIGIILYQLLHGYFPITNDANFLTSKEREKVFSIRNDTARANEFDNIIKQKLCRGTLCNLNTLPLYIDQKFKKVIRKAIHLDYRKRYISAAEFLKEVHKLIREFPSYAKVGDCLHVFHDNGKEFKLWQAPGGEFVLEKSVKNGWRRVNSHDGTFQSALELVNK